MASVLDFDEIRRLSKETYEETSEEPVEERKKRMRDWFEEMLIDAYIAGFTGTGLPIRPVMDPEHVDKEVIHATVGGKTFVDRLNEHIDSDQPGRIENLAESEAHRVSETGAYDTAVQVAQKLSQMSDAEILDYIREHSGGKDSGSRQETQKGGKNEPEWAVFATWATMRDDRVRETHDYLEGMTQLFGRRFYSFDGDSARFPGDFSLPDNNVNCRCHLNYTIQRV